jgi:hypothetical protein
MPLWVCVLLAITVPGCEFLSLSGLDDGPATSVDSSRPDSPTGNACPVVFTVQGVPWDPTPLDGGSATGIDNVPHQVFAVGSEGALGGWQLVGGLHLNESPEGSGTWSGETAFADGVVVQFKFTRPYMSNPVDIWEGDGWLSAGLYSVNRSLRVDCAGTHLGGPIEGGTPANGKTYMGIWNVRPVDAISVGSAP